MESIHGASVYERWVNTLRAWAQAPENTSLQDLPSLAEDTFSQDTYRRLIDHLLEAMRAANERWHQGLTRAWSTAASPFELARELVDLRVTLGRRLQLAKHPGLPQAVQEALLEGLRTDVARYQQEVEDGIRRQRSSSSLDSGWRDQMLAVVRENSFAAVLAYDVSGHRPQVAALPATGGTAPAAPRATRPRRIVPVTRPEESND